MKCLVCDSRLKDTNKGRPKIYCSDPCSKYAKYINAAKAAALEIQFSTESLKLVKGDLFRLCNQLTQNHKN